MLGLSYPGTSSRVTVASLVASSSRDGVHTVSTTGIATNTKMCVP